jgi:hypothetical protein
VPPPDDPTPSPRRDRALGVVVSVVCLAAIALPLAVVRYPPMTDLPFHAAQSAVFAHLDDPAWHFREQFELHPFAVPYTTMFALAGALMRVVSPVVAMKLAAGAMLALLPLGLATLLRGLGKSPHLAVLAVLAAWGPLTHMGFLNFVGALGLFALAVGLALRLPESPRFAPRLGLAALLVALFYTHAFRFPFAVLGVGAAAFAAFAARGRAREVPGALAAVLAAPLAVFAAWIVLRPRTISASLGPLSLQLDRVRELGCLTGSFRDPAERVALWLAGAGLVAYVAIVARARRLAPTGVEPLEAARIRRAALLVGLGCALASLVAYLVLPMSLGGWWYVYPREATAAAFLAFALVPDLPRASRPRVIALAVALATPLPTAAVVARNYAAFRAEADDLDAVVAALPAAPRLAYLVFDHEGSARTISPFTHLPAWVQAQKGGWLSFHFEHFGSAPVSYRPRSPGDRDVPPPTPDAWEFRPDAFVIDDERGRFFDWFLVRAREAPTRVFEADPSVVPVLRAGRYWLYRRVPAT